MKILTDIKKDFADILGALKDVLKSKPSDPKEYASDPPTFWHKPAPVANVEKKKESNPLEIDFESNMIRESIALTNEERDEYFKENPNAKVITDSEAKKIVERRNAKEIQF